MKCIICNEDRNPSDEHIIPDAIGGKIKTNNVCEECNKKLGNYIDSPMVNDPLFELYRYSLGTENREGKQAPVFKKIHRWLDDEGKLVTIKDGDDTLFPKGVHYDGTMNPVVNIEPDMDTRTAYIEYSGSDITSVVTKIVREAKKKGLDISPDDVLAIVKESISLERKEVHEGMFFNIEKYIPCVLKIAYEICAKHLNGYLCHDAVGEKIRAFLYYSICEKHPMIPSDLVLSTNVLLEAPQKRHCILIYLLDNQVVTEITLFNVITFRVKVSENSENYSSLISNPIAIQN